MSWQRLLRRLSKSSASPPMIRPSAKLLQTVRARLKFDPAWIGSLREFRIEAVRLCQRCGHIKRRKQPSNLLSQGVRQFRARDFAGAQALFSRAAQEIRRTLVAKLYLARCNFALGNYDQAIELLKQPEQFGRHELEALYWAGKSYQELAAQTLEKMIGIDPNSYRVHQMNGALLEDKRKYAEAIDAYQKALKPSPDLMGLRFAIGNTYWKMQNLDEALVWLKDELARNPYHALANYKVGSIYLSKGNTEHGGAVPRESRSGQPDLVRCAAGPGKGLHAAWAGMKRLLRN